MAKGIIYAVILVLVIELALIFFGGVTGNEKTILYRALVIGEGGWGSFYLVFTAGLAALAAATVVAGLFYNVNQYGVYASVAVVILSFILNIVHLSTFIYGELSAILSTELTAMIVALITGPLIIFYSFTTFEWTRSMQ